MHRSKSQPIMISRAISRFKHYNEVTLHYELYIIFLIPYSLQPSSRIIETETKLQSKRKSAPNAAASIRASPLPSCKFLAIPGPNEFILNIIKYYIIILRLIRKKNIDI